MKFLSILAAAAFAACASSQESPKNQHFVGAFYGTSGIFLGSSQYRYGGGIDYGFAAHEPRFENSSLTAQVVYEGYVDHTAAYRTPHQASEAVGVLAYGRWFTRQQIGSLRPFFDVGMGFQYADTPTRDLPSEINSTPVLALGMMLPCGDGHDLALSVRLLHISNAGFVTPNRGQNEFFFMAAFTF